MPPAPPPPSGSAPGSVTSLRTANQRRVIAVLRERPGPAEVTQAAIARATETVTDRFGGTRIATNIEALLASHHCNALRGGVVIVASDGWDTDPPERLAATMARLRRRAYRILWLNPRAGAPRFTPRVAAMAAALPFCDAMLPAATFADLAAAVRHLRK